MNVLYILSLVGVAVFAVSGAISARRNDFDLLGVLVIAVVTAIGGGTLRDLLLDRNPVFWIGDTNYLLSASTAGIITVIYTRYHTVPFRWLLYADGFGLALFTISGTRIAEQVGVSPGISVLMGCMTGVAGGVVRDVLSAQAPLLFRDRELYATAAFAGSLVYLVLYKLANLSMSLSAILGVIVIILLRFASIWWRLRIPVVKMRNE